MLKLKKIIFCAVFAMLASNAISRGAGVASGVVYSEATFGKAEHCKFRSRYDDDRENQLECSRSFEIGRGDRLSDLKSKLYNQFGKTGATHSLKIFYNGRQVQTIKDLCGCSSAPHVNVVFIRR
jgi:hypothetical protein